MSKIISISTSEELYEALEQATGGETFLLEPGEYGHLMMNGKPGFPNQFASTITITSADPENPAVFNQLDIHSGKNIAVDSVILDYTFQPGDPDWVRPFEVNKSQNVSITNTVFAGDLVLDGEASADGYGHGYGLSVRDSQDVVVEGNEFFGFGRGAIFGRSEGLTVKGNDIHDIRSDGLNFAEVQNVVIEDNYIHDFKAAYNSQDHRDMIQFWTSGTNSPSTDIVIRNNTLDMGEGSFTQSIFMRNESVDSQGGGPEMYYQNVVIEDNTIYNGHLHGITVGETNGLAINGNSLVAVADPNNIKQSGSILWVPLINVNDASKNVSIQSNATAQINGNDGQTDWLVKDNAFIQNSDPTKPGYYNDVFVTSSMTVNEQGHHFVSQPGSMLDVLNAGVSHQHQADTLDKVGALFEVNATGNDVNERVFDASLTAQMLADANVDLADVTFQWSFGDGTSATGQVVEHGFTHAGGHDVTLTVTLISGETYLADSIVDIRGGKVLSFDGSAGNFVTSHGFGESQTLEIVDAFTDGAIRLGESGDPAKISRGALEGIRGSDALNIDFTLNGSTTGELFRMHMSFVVKVNPDGEIYVQMYNQDTQNFVVTTNGVRVNDGQSHDISIQLDDGSLTVLVDNQIAGETAFSGTLPTSGSWDMIFGNPWNPNADFNGSIPDFEITAGVELDTLVSSPEVVSEGLETSGPDTSPPVDSNNVPDETGANIADADESTTTHATELTDAFEAVSDDSGIHINGDGDYVNLGRLTDFEDSESVGFAVEFTASEDIGENARLIWNHMKLGLTLVGDEVMVNAATKDQGFKHFVSDGLDLARGEAHKVVVMLDSATDRLQVLVDDKIAIDINDVDFDHVGAGGHEWGWFVGTPWNNFYEGDVSGLEISDQIHFQEDDMAGLNTIGL